MKINSKNIQMRKGVIELCILSLLKNGEMYSTDLLKALKEADIIIVEGTIYPLLTRLKNEGLLKYRWEESSGGPPRKYFSITSLGEEKQKQLSYQWKELEKSVNQIINKQ